ncbi:MAG: ATP synthase F1 subunit gamma [Sumerlaeia bacterium]
MAKGVKELRRRIKSIKNTKKITRAMEMVAAAKLRRTQHLMEASKPFMSKIETLLGRLALDPKVADHPLFKVNPKAEKKPPLVVLYTSDRGLCGAFNANLIKMASRYLAKNPDALMYCIGRKGRDFFKKRIGDRLIGFSVDLGGSVDAHVTEEINRKLLAMWNDGEVSRIDFVSPDFISTSTQRPRVSRFLPLEPQAFGLKEEDAGKPIDYILEPSPEAVFNALLPTYLGTKIYLLVAEGMTSEHASRMLAMNAATKNSNELMNKLTLQMNKARQSAITTEIIEIVAGADALAG